jgi:hypothetical protein
MAANSKAILLRFDQRGVPNFRLPGCQTCRLGVAETEAVSVPPSYASPGRSSASGKASPVFLAP